MPVNICSHQFCNLIFLIAFQLGGIGFTAAAELQTALKKSVGSLLWDEIRLKKTVLEMNVEIKKNESLQT